MFQPEDHIDAANILTALDSLNHSSSMPIILPVYKDLEPDLPDAEVFIIPKQPRWAQDISKAELPNIEPPWPL